METDENAEVRIPIGEALPGISIHELEDPAEWVFVLARTVADDGDKGWAYRTSGAPNREELLGALVVQVEVLKREICSEWESE
ncbi:hypothetical protein [Demequina capsici]|uniref:Uncharacterized protein n=1 Tax=Demequina capsici TaxID=3075620 RepID=A0AA96F644_9MICO|nr:hypothetical protein [Demequina sp. OYTSA14]WNM24384.1 hypothetical protein RN606_13620 [Demequina sp. OYTSA14]